MLKICVYFLFKQKEKMNKIFKKCFANILFEFDLQSFQKIFNKLRALSVIWRKYDFFLKFSFAIILLEINLLNRTNIRIAVVRRNGDLYNRETSAVHSCLFRLLILMIWVTKCLHLTSKCSILQKCDRNIFTASTYMHIFK